MKYYQAYSSGISFKEFMYHSKCHQAEIISHYDNIIFNPAIISSVRELNSKITNPVYALVITEEWCIDSVLNLPVIEKIIELLSAIHLKIVRRSAWSDLAAKYPSRGGKNRLPTLILFDPISEKELVWAERCRSNHQWFKEFTITHPIPNLEFIEGMPAPDLLQWMKLRFSAEIQAYYSHFLNEVVEEITKLIREFQ